MTNTTISWIKFENKDIINVIKAADPCKSQGYDDISITMSKISVITHFQIIVKKKQIFVPFRKKVMNK